MTNESTRGRRTSSSPDLHIDDDVNWATLVDRAEELGATRESEYSEGGVRWIVLRDPDGNRFRVFAPRPS